MALDMNALRSKLGELTRKGSATNDLLWKPTEGDSVVRIIPLAADTSFPFLELQFYYDLPGRSILSPLSYGEADPISEFCQTLRTGTLTKDEFKATLKFSPKTRTYVPIIVRGEEGKGVRFWGFGKTIYEELLTIMGDDDYGDITHPETGSDIKVSFVPADLKAGRQWPKTDIRVARSASPLSTDKAALKQWLTEQPDIFDVFEKKSYSELETILAAVLNPPDVSAILGGSAGVVAGDDGWGSPVVTTESVDSDEGEDTPMSVAPTLSKAAGQSVEDKFASMFGDD